MGTVHSLRPTPGPWLVVGVDSGPWRVQGLVQHSCSSTDKGKESRRCWSHQQGAGLTVVLLGQADFLPSGQLCLHAHAAQSVTRAEGGLARARQTELTCSLLERAKNSCRQWSKTSVCGGVRAGWQRDEPVSALGGDNGAADGAVCCHGRELPSVTHLRDRLRESTHTVPRAVAAPPRICCSCGLQPSLPQSHTGLRGAPGSPQPELEHPKDREHPWGDLPARHAVPDVMGKAGLVQAVLNHR